MSLTRTPCSQRPPLPREAGQWRQPALGANAGAQTNSLRAKALRSNSVCESEHEVWLSYGSQTAGVNSDRRRWLEGVEGSKQPARVVPIFLLRVQQSLMACFVATKHTWPSLYLKKKTLNAGNTAGFVTTLMLPETQDEAVKKAIE